MICIDQNTATRNREALSILAEVRGKKMPFGIYLEWDFPINSSLSNETALIETGCTILCNTDD